MRFDLGANKASGPDCYSVLSWRRWSRLGEREIETEVDAGCHKVVGD